MNSASILFSPIVALTAEKVLCTLLSMHSLFPVGYPYSLHHFGGYGANDTPASTVNFEGPWFQCNPSPSWPRQWSILMHSVSWSVKCFVHLLFSCLYMTLYYKISWFWLPLSTFVCSLKICSIPIHYRDSYDDLSIQKGFWDAYDFLLMRQIEDPWRWERRK